MTPEPANPRFRRTEADPSWAAGLSDAELLERLEELRTDKSPCQAVSSAQGPTQLGDTEYLLGQAEAARTRQQAREIVESLPADSPDWCNLAADAAAYRLLGIAPRDAIEEMLATQMLALHGAVMDCTRRAMLPGQPGPFRREELGLATKASRGFAQLADTLDRRRRGGEQKMTVEHVHVHAGGQAIVGNVKGGSRKNGKE